MRSITVSHTTLFHIAAQYLGDATMWIYLAELNHLQDPFIEGLVELSLPRASNLQGGGIVAQ
jgi:hypothetical protein